MKADVRRRMRVGADLGWERDQKLWCIVMCGESSCGHLVQIGGEANER